MTGDGLRDERHWQQRVADAIGDHEHLTEQIDAVMEWVVRPLVTARDAAVARAEAAEAAIERVRALADAYARSMSGMFTGQLLARDIRAALDPAGPTDA